MQEDEKRWQDFANLQYCKQVTKLSNEIYKKEDKILLHCKPSFSSLHGIWSLYWNVLFEREISITEAWLFSALSFGPATSTKRKKHWWHWNNSTNYILQGEFKLSIFLLATTVLQLTYLDSQPKRRAGTSNHRFTSLPHASVTWYVQYKLQ